MHYVNESPHGDRSRNACVCVSMSVCLSESTVAVLIEMYLKNS